MPDTPQETSLFRHPPRALGALALASVVLGMVMRGLASQGELWLDELWSRLHVASIHNPLEILTDVKHDNNHLLNSLWLWFVGPDVAYLVYRLPSLAFSALLLLLLAREAYARREQAMYMMWLILVAVSYPLILYSTEARGYSLALLMSVVGFVSLLKLREDPSNTRAALSFGVAGIIGCLSHAIYALFLAPAIAWLGYMFLTSNARANSGQIIRLGLIPPVLATILLLNLFYTGMEIGGAPLLPYLEVAASTISVAFGGESLSASAPTVTGWSLFLALTITIIGVIELVSWIRSRDPVAILVGLILVTPWVAVAVCQPHFILGRYFVIQVVFAYLLLARFLVRLMKQGPLGACVSFVMTLAFITCNARHSYQLVSLGRSHFVEIFTTLSNAGQGEMVPVSGDQDFQNSLRLSYAQTRTKQPLFIHYLTRDYRGKQDPRFVVRESIDAHEQFPDSWTSSKGITYNLKTTYMAPPLNGANVYVYEAAQ